MTRPVVHEHIQETDEEFDREMTDAEYAQSLTDQATRDEKEKEEQALADAKASGITHALSLGFTQAQAEAMFP